MLPRNTSIGTIEITEIFDFYDFPRIFTCVNRAGQRFLAISVEDTVNSNKFIYSAVSLERYKLLLSERLDIHTVVAKAEDGFVFLVDIGEQGDSVSVLPCTDIPPKWLPPQGEFLENSEVSIQSAGILPAASVANSTRRETTNFALKLPKNSTQIASRTLGHFLTATQELLDAIGQACTGEPTLKGAIPRKILDQTSLLVTETYAGSFGVQFVSESTGDLLEDSLAGDALQKLFDLIRAESDSEQLSGLLHSLKGRATTKYRVFLEALIESDGYINVEWGSPKISRGGSFSMSRETILEAHRIVSRVEQEIGEEIQVYGTLVGLNVRTKSYEIFGITDNIKYAGKVSEDAPESIYHAVLSEPYDAVLKRIVEVQATSGEERERWLLVDLKPPHSGAHT